jgi:tRNA(Ile)-lysidine synthetase-like protein
MIKLNKIISKDRQYHFAVSMGVDSVAAYHWMISKGYNVIPVHFNHKIRPQNDLMEQKFYELCKDSKYIVGCGKDLKTESECRKARIDFFNKTGQDYSRFLRANFITAHHLNDWVESYLLNCFRGKPDHVPFNLTSDFENFTIIHPFLASRKRDFFQYAQRNDLLKFIVEDETNNINKGSRRNWIRNNIVPEMKKEKLSLEKFALRKICEL